MLRSGRLAAIVAGMLLGGCGGDRGGSSSDPDASVPRADFGDPCGATEECASLLCVSSGGPAYCTRTCASDSDCPAAPNWGCVTTTSGLRVCGCASDSADEVCGDGLDNDCNGDVDDCRLCDGVPTPIDHPDHCGECHHACRTDQTCRDATCLCTNLGETECESECVDLDSSSRHCGGCGRACPAEQVCVAGSCECPAGGPSDHCPGVGCVDLFADARNCGACGTICPTPQLCIDGDCRCPPGGPPDYCAETGCVDTTRDDSHCGACGRACRLDQRCAGGSCVCDAGLTDCAGDCRDTSSDPSNCGGCGVVCRTGERCAGRCVCDSGVICDGVCRSPSDASNCGGCGIACGPTQYCSGGRCLCSDGRSIACGTSCFDILGDPANCGSCGRVCRPSEICLSGSCACPGGSTWCDSASRCIDLSSSRDHCGACDRACPAATSCMSASCRCPTFSDTYCASVDACVSTSSDALHCGACDRVCRATEVCTSGTCRCPGASERWCPSAGRCVDSATDEAHCGACDRTCASDQTCAGGYCTCMDSSLTPCPTGCTSLSTDPANCGTCGRACGGRITCSFGTCSCPAPTPGSPVVVGTLGPGNGVAASPSTIAVGWSSATNARLSFFNPDGTRSTVPDYVVPGSVYAWDLIFNGTEFVLVWSAPGGASGSRPRCRGRLPRNRTCAVHIRLFGTGGCEPAGQPVLDLAHPSSSMSCAAGAPMFARIVHQWCSIETSPRSSQREFRSARSTALV